MAKWSLQHLEVVGVLDNWRHAPPFDIFMGHANLCLEHPQWRPSHLRS